MSVELNKSEIEEIFNEFTKKDDYYPNEMKPKTMYKLLSGTGFDEGDIRYFVDDLGTGNECDKSREGDELHPSIKSPDINEQKAAKVAYKIKEKDGFIA